MGVVGGRSSYCATDPAAALFVSRVESWSGPRWGGYGGGRAPRVCVPEVFSLSLSFVSFVAVVSPSATLSGRSRGRENNTR